MSITVASEPTFGNIARQMNKLVEQVQKGYSPFCPGETWTPNVNLYETEEAYVVCVDLAGVDKEKIDVVVADQHLTLRGTRAVPLHGQVAAEQQPRRLRVHLMEIDHGAFCRAVELPRDVRHDRIVATYINGMLWVELPKK